MQRHIGTIRRDAAIAMKLADPCIQVTCSGAHGPNAAMDPYLFQAAGKHLDLISVHEYWIPNYQRHQTPDYLTCMMLAEKPDAHLLTAIRSLDGGGVRGRMKIAFDEWNLRSWHHPGFSGHRPRKVDDADPAVAALSRPGERAMTHRSTPWPTRWTAVCWSTAPRWKVRSRPRCSPATQPMPTMMSSIPTG